MRGTGVGDVYLKGTGQNTTKCVYYSLDRPKCMQIGLCYDLAKFIKSYLSLHYCLKMKHTFLIFNSIFNT
jgi:hypothetical protein